MHLAKLILVGLDAAWVLLGLLAAYLLLCWLQSRLPPRSDNAP